MSEIITDVNSFEPGDIVELFELDLSTGAADDDYPIFRWHSGAGEDINEIVWQGNRYTSFPIEAEGFEFSGKGSLPRPTITIANVTSLLSSAINDYKDLVGGKVTRKRTFAKYLDSHCYVLGYNLGGLCTGETDAYCSDSAYDNLIDCENAGETWYGSLSKADCLSATKYGSAGTWTAYDQSDCDGDGGIWYLNSTADADATFVDEIWYIDRKAVENPAYLQFELTAAYDVHGVKLPARTVTANACPWKYKGTECGYDGSNGAWDVNNISADAADDVCGKTFASCELRFPETDESPFGGFPGAGIKSGAVR